MSERASVCAWGINCLAHDVSPSAAADALHDRRATATAMLAGVVSIVARAGERNAGRDGGTDGVIKYVGKCVSTVSVVGGGEREREARRGEGMREHDSDSCCVQSHMRFTVCVSVSVIVCLTHSSISRLHQLLLLLLMVQQPLSPLLSLASFSRFPVNEARL